ncbi:hypothetical protein ACFL6S_04100 [Candidatus Poribacteria bacterium]
MSSSLQNIRLRKQYLGSVLCSAVPVALLVFCILCVAILFTGCSEPKDEITTPPVDELPDTKEPLKEYHPVDYLTTELRSAPMLDQKNHPSGWNKQNCIECHRSPLKEIDGVCTGCHGENKTIEAKSSCSNCHKTQSEFGDPASGSHQGHVAKGAKDTTCVKCHTGSPEQSISHANGILDIQIINDGKYTPLAQQKNGVTGSCSNIVCHQDVRDWGGDCSSCHDNPPDTGQHKEHLVQEDLSCESCHSKNQHDSDKESGTIELGGIEYDGITGDCTSTCHEKPLNWTCLDCHAYPPDTGNHSASAHDVNCGECHSGHDHSYKAATLPLDFSKPEVSFAQGGDYRDDNKLCSGVPCHIDEREWGTSCTDCHDSPPDTGTHELHVQQQNLKCQDCHSDNQHDLDSSSGSIELGGIVYDSITGDCTSTCHTERNWSCTDCHSFPPDSGNHVAHNGDCSKCHDGHEHSYKAAIQPEDFTDTQVSIADGGQYSSTDRSCSGLTCHESRTWGSNCTDCHANPPNTGTHILHVDQQSLKCQDCHSDNQHDLDRTSGSIELGGIEYNSITGDCASTCHAERKWSCTDCHSFPPDSGNHADHNGDCGKCHDGHEHSYKAATQPQDFTDTQVSIADSGQFNTSSGLCSGLPCHESRTWGSSCTDCHSNPPDTGTHIVHVDQQGLVCQDCHSDNQHDLNNNSGFIELGGIEYNSVTGDCASTCHTERKWDCMGCHDFPPDSGNHLDHNGDCGKCHDGHDHSYKAALQPTDLSDTQVSIADGGQFSTSSGLCSGLPCHESRTWGSSCTDCHSNPPDTGTHILHVDQQSLACQDCHSDNQHDLDNSSGSIELGGIEYNSVTGDCASTCHAERKWDCTACHSFPPDSGNHIVHDGDCSKCHDGHDHSYKAALQPQDFTDTQVSIADGGQFSPSSGACSGLPCHGTRTWGENCTDCHSNPPETGTHVVHVLDQEISCQNCHADNQHDSNVQSGSIELGGIGYDPNTGDCTSTCHGQRSWSCTECHDNPPATGNHPDHESDCGQCHQDHQHSYKAAMTPEDLSSVMTDFAVDGDFDPQSGTCSSVECHPDPRAWGADCSACHLNPPTTGPHVLHVEQEKSRCYDCHAENQHDLDNSSGSIELGGIEYDSVTGDCASTCHEQRRWNCTECHDNPPDTGNHPSHNKPSGRLVAVEEGTELEPVSCGECHSGHEHSYKAALAPGDLSMIQLEFAQGGIFGADSSCINIACHDTMVWGSSCSDCHATPPETGLHQKHIESDLNCTQCHEGSQHDLDISSGFTEVGGITYDGTKGGCTSNCHASQELWDCTSCHDYPPDAGQHDAHARLGFACNMCHSENNHTYKATIAPEDLGDVAVKFAISGNWDKVTSTCISVGCHNDRQW